MMDHDHALYEHLDSTLLQSRLETSMFGRELRLYDSLPSTQDEARKWVAQGAPHGALVLAEEQTSGRGRFGRQWISPSGKGVWMSIILKPDKPFLNPAQLTLLCAVALCRAVRKLTGLDAGIKWPNDLLINARKVSGILLESVEPRSDGNTIIIAGIGISVNLQQEDYPDWLQPKATSLRIESGNPVDRYELISAFLKQLEELYVLYLREGFSAIRSLWEAHSLTLCQNISVQMPEGIVTGLAVRLDETGALIIRTADGNEHKIFSGDIF
ncbi:MAG: biotin--[acetyl-CoA-carboxylase] ligase [Gorillibacterium sp.]|nr:biotin--[acetyl-CoA-carboxylase] ligase [Gorillibacterium sp.]